jgi:hypothetical protein
MIDTHVALEAEIERLKSEIAHLKRCKEFESSFQREVLEVGSEFVRYPDGKTYSVTETWWAIKKNLEQLEDDQKAYLTRDKGFVDAEGNTW